MTRKRYLLVFFFLIFFSISCSRQQSYESDDLDISGLMHDFGLRLPENSTIKQAITIIGDTNDAPSRFLIFTAATSDMETMLLDGQYTSKKPYKDLCNSTDYLYSHLRKYSSLVSCDLLIVYKYPKKNNSSVSSVNYDNQTVIGQKIDHGQSIIGIYYEGI